MAYQRYPLTMTHPAFDPGERAANVEGNLPHYSGGRPSKFAPVVVMNADDEARHAAMGYRGNADPEAFRQQQEGIMRDYKPKEYPKWIGARIAHNSEEEAQLREIYGPAPETVRVIVPSDEDTSSPDWEPEELQFMRKIAEKYGVPVGEPTKVIIKQVSRVCKVPDQSDDEQRKAFAESSERKRKAWTPERKAKAAESARKRWEKRRQAAEEFQAPNENFGDA